MKIKVNKMDILKKVKVLSKMPRGSRLSSQISEQIFFALEDGIVKVMVYDGDRTFSTMNLNTIECEVGEENLFNMELKLLLPIINKIGNEIELELKEKYIVIKSNRSRFEIYRNKLDEVWGGYSKPKIEGDDVTFEIESMKLKRMLESVIVSASEGKENQNLNVVQIKLTDSVLELSATDGYRASIISQSIEGIEGKELVNCLLSKESIPVITEMLGAGDVAKVSINNKAIRIQVQDMMVTVRCSEIGKYPDVKKLLANEGERVLDVNRKEWTSAIDGISNLGANLIRLNSEGNSGKIKIAGESDLSKSYEVSGEVEVEVEGDVKDAISMLFINKLLIEGIRSVDSDKIQVRMKGPNDFITVRPSGELEQVNIILPCRNV